MPFFMCPGRLIREDGLQSRSNYMDALNREIVPMIPPPVHAVKPCVRGLRRSDRMSGCTGAIKCTG
jgi:hypothetical protein